MITKEQQQLRRNAIGASDAAAILGEDPWSTPLEKFLEKTGLSEPQDIRFGTPLYWGNLLEDSVAKAYQDFMGLKVRKSLVTLKHKNYDFVICHLDRKVEGQRRILECKTSHAASSLKWGEHGTDDIPFNYLIQVQHQMAVTDYDEADVAVLIGGTDFRCYNIKRDEIAIKYIIEQENKFWEQHVIPKIPPEPTCRKDILLLNPKDNGAAIDATDEIAEEVNNLIELKNVSKLNEINQEELQNKIALYMKENSSLQYYGKEILTWKADKNGRRNMRIK